MGAEGSGCLTMRGRHFSGGDGLERIEVAVDRLRTAHPGLGPDATDPVGEARDEPQILANMLFPTRRAGITRPVERSEEHTSELQSLMRISYAVFCLKKKTKKQTS